MAIRDFIRPGIAVGVIAGTIILWGGDKYQPPRPDPSTEVIDAFPNYQFDVMKKKLVGKKLALALISNFDYTGGLKDIEKTFTYDFKDIPNYVLFTARTFDRENLFNNLRDYSLLQPIDALILTYHGSQNTMSVNLWESITSANALQLFQHYRPVFSKDAIILLYSCKTGKGNYSVAISLSDALNIDVVAPRYLLDSETSLDLDTRLGEFCLDNNQRLTFDTSHFAFFDQLSYRGKMYSHVVATFAHEKPLEQIIGKRRNDNFLFINK